MVKTVANKIWKEKCLPGLGCLEGTVGKIQNDTIYYFYLLHLAGYSKKEMTQKKRNWPGCKQKGTENIHKTGNSQGWKREQLLYSKQYYRGLETF